VNEPLEDIASYSAFVYALQARHRYVKGSTLTLASIAATLAKLERRIEGEGDIHLEVWELVDFATHHIRSYSYGVYRAGEKVSWYDACVMMDNHYHLLPPVTMAIRRVENGAEPEPRQLRRQLEMD
jgi:hypothetical protein